MSEILAFKEGRVGRIRLNRPKQLHALNTAMCEAMLETLAVWETDPAVEAVLIDHAEGRGFCAGGDIRMVAESGAADGVAARAFFFTEYRMNHRLFTYPKPTIAFVDGITMGGGVGLSLPCRYRVATENTRWAMPETGIGLFPDVGGGWFLSRLAGRAGQYLALTARRLNGWECLNLGLTTHHLASEKLELVKGLLAKWPRDGETMLGDYSSPGAKPPNTIVFHQDEIDRLFASDRLEDIFTALQADDGEFARETLATLRTKSPQAMKVSLKVLRDGATMPTFEDEMRQEYAVASRVVQRHDFLEGVRAVIVDKDNAPRWDPVSADEVSDHLIDQIFAPLPDAEAWMPA